MIGQPQQHLKQRGRTVTMVVIIMTLSALVHAGVWWAYQQQAIILSAGGDAATATPKTVAVKLTKPQPSPEQQKPEPPPEPKPKPKAKAKPEPRPEPRPEPKPKPEPEPTPEEQTETAEPSEDTQDTQDAEPKANQEADDTQDSEQSTPAQSSLQAFNNRPPAYPRSARRRRLEGEVTLKILVTAAGRAETVEVVTSSGHPVLDKAAVQAVKNWRFKAATQRGKPRSGYAMQTINFKLSR